jgi:hypothetical protein
VVQYEFPTPHVIRRGKVVTKDMVVRAPSRPRSPVDMVLIQGSSRPFEWVIDRRSD